MAVAERNYIDVNSESPAALLADACTFTAAVHASDINLPVGGCASGSATEIDVVRLPPGALITYGGPDSPLIPAATTSTTAGTLEIEGRGSRFRRDPTLPPCPQDGTFADEGRLFLLASSGIRIRLSDLVIDGFCGGFYLGAGIASGALILRPVEALQLDRVRILAAGGLGGIDAQLGTELQMSESSISNVTAYRARRGSALSLASVNGRTDPLLISIERSYFGENRHPDGTASPQGNLWGGVLNLSDSNRTVQLSVSNSTFYRNRGVAQGAAIGLDADSAVVVLSHNTFSRNSNALVSAEGASLHLDIGGQAMLHNTVFEGADLAHCRYLGIAPALIGRNLAADSGCPGFDPVGRLDLRLPGLYRGYVFSMPPLAGSVVIDSDSSGGCAQTTLIDVRGVARPQDGNGDGAVACDPGAVEFVRNQTPSISAPVSVVAQAGTPHLFAPGSADAVVVTDPDADSLPLSLDVRTSRGRLLIGAADGMQCSLGNSGPQGDVQHRCSGSLDALNQALQGLTLLSTTGDVGSAAVRIEIDDGGAGGDDNRPLQALREIAVELRAAQALIALSPSELDFGAVDVGLESEPITARINSVGGLALAISQIEMIDPSGEFSSTSDCPVGGTAVVEPDAHCTLSLRFLPLHPGNRDAAVRIHSNASGSPHTLALSGQGRGLQLFHDGFE